MPEDLSGSGRFLIVNADDFGQSDGINRGIIRAFGEGIVTSASLMVRWPAARAAAAWARAHRLDLGLHLDLGEWTLQSGTWTALYEVVPLGDAAAVATEVSAQIEGFRAFVGENPTHLDSHQHVHLKPTVRPAVEDAARRLGIPVRHLDSRIQYCGDFYGQDEHGLPLLDRISVPSLIGILQDMKPGITELSCHPGDAAGLDTLYQAERRMETSVLCDPAVRGSMEELGIHLTSFFSMTSSISGKG